MALIHDARWSALPVFKGDGDGEFGHARTKERWERLQ